MLKIDIDRNKEEMLIGCGGSMPEILSDLGSAVHAIHIRLCRQNLFAGLDFERAIRNPEFWEIVFKPSEVDSEIFNREGESDD